MNEFRKPGTAMWLAMLADHGLSKNTIVEAFYVGDAAGRATDRADSDRYVSRATSVYRHESKSQQHITETCCRRSC